MKKFWQQLTSNSWWPIIQGLMIIVVLLATTMLSQSLYKKRPLLNSRSPKTTQFVHRPLSSFDLQAKTVTGDLEFQLDRRDDQLQVTVNREQSQLQFSTALKGAQLEFDQQSGQFISQDQGQTINYQTLDNGLKEQIILDQAPETNQLISSLELQNLQAYYRDQQIIFTDQEGSYQFHLAAPYAYDAAGNYTYAVYYQLVPYDGQEELDQALTTVNDGPLISQSHAGGQTVSLLDQQQAITNSSTTNSKKAQSYQLITIIDQNWLTDEQRLYPITIDPTVVHDESSEFAAGSLDRVTDTGSGTSPNLTLSYQNNHLGLNTKLLYHLDETNGDLAGDDIFDSSGNDYDGEIYGSNLASAVVAGVIGNAREFNGSDDYVLRTSNVTSDVSDWTIMAWIKPANLSQIGIAVYNGSNAGGFGFGISNGSSSAGNKFVGVFGNVGWLDSGYSFTEANRWYHVTMTRDGSTTRFYVDGVQTSNTTSATPLTIGSFFSVGAEIDNSGSPYRYFAGAIDEVQVFDKLISLDEIKLAAQHYPSAIYTSPVIDFGNNATSWNSFSWSELGVGTGDGETAANNSNLVAQWKFNETSGTTADNAAGTCGSSCDGTLTNFSNTSSQDIIAASGWTSDNGRWPSSGPAALMFDGVDDYVNTGLNPSTTLGNDFTISAWIKINNQGNYRGVAGNHSSYQGIAFLQNNHSSNYWSVTYGDGAAWRSLHVDESDLTLGEWHYVVGVYDTGASGSITAYVDGLKVASMAVSTTVSHLSSFYIGRALASSDRYFDGTIDNIQVYSRLLTPSEVLANYNAGNIQLQTRVGSDASPDDGTNWDAWQPSGVETQIESFDDNTVTCTGGNSVIGNIHIFTSNGTFNCTEDAYVDVLVLGGGGGGGKSDSSTRSAGGGGAGGLIYEQNYLISSGNTSVTIGSGGDGSLGLSGDGGEVANIRSGENSVFGSLTAIGGGGGGNGGAGDGADGGSGGGSGRNELSNVGSGTPGQGYNGGYGASGTVSTSGGGGGGGASEAGSNGTSSVGGAGGDGIAYDISGTLTTYAGGGGGGRASGSGGSGGSGGGGAGNSGGGDGSDGATNTGGGGGGASNVGNGGDGGSGIVIVKVLMKASSVVLTDDGLIAGLTDTSLKKEGVSSTKIQPSITDNDANVLALYHLDETNGDLAGDDIFDSSGNSHNGEIYGSGLANGVIDGLIGKARNFNGSDDYIDLGTGINLANQSFTIATWAKTSTTGVYQIIAGQGSPANNIGLHFGFRPTNIFTCAFYGNDLDTPAGYLDDAWHHWVCTYDASNRSRRIYRDGVQIANDTASANYQGSGSFTIGQGPLGDPYNFPGDIDEFQLFDVSLTPNQVGQLYQLGAYRRLSQTLTTSNLSNKSLLSFWMASDSPGNFLEATVGESAYTNGLADNNTAALFHFDEYKNDLCNSSGDDACDSSSHGNDGSNSGTSITTGKSGFGRYFNGSSYIQIPNSSSLQITGDGTWSGWIKVDLPLASRGSVIFKHYNNEFEIILGTDGIVQVYHGDGTWEEIDEPSRAKVKDNQWTHFAVVRHQSTKTYDWYIDGSYRGSDSYTTNPASSTNPVYLGARSGSSSHLLGYLDEISISNIARTATEIRQSYERGSRTHPIVIDFAASLDSANLIASTADTSFTIDATTKGLTAKGSHLYPGDTIIIKENVAGTEYLAQGLVSTINQTTGATSVASWQTGSTVPSGGFTVNATVFKWQREYFPVGQLLADRDKDAISHLTLRLTNGDQGRTVWLDDMRSVSDYLTNPTGSTITSALGKRYFQYRVIFSTQDLLTAPSLTSVTLDYISNLAPNAPDFGAAYLHDNLQTTDSTPEIRFSASDNESDDLVYEINWATDGDFASPTSKVSDTDSGFANITTPADNSPFNADDVISYTFQSALSNHTTYFYRVRAKDPTGANTWGDWSATRSLTIDTDYNQAAWFQTHADQFSTDSYDATIDIDDTNNQVQLLVGETTGQIMSSAITAANIRSDALYWGHLINNDEQTNGSISYQIYYENSGPTLVPDTDLPGNSSGVDWADLNLTNLSISSYPILYLAADLTKSSDTPILYDWRLTLLRFLNPPTAPTSLLTEGATDPNQVTDLTPEFSALYQDPDASDYAIKYQIQVSTYRNFYSLLWDSGEVGISNLNVGNRVPDISYSGPSLDYDGSTYFWRIRFIDSEDMTGDWSANGQFTMNDLVNPTACLVELDIEGTDILLTWSDNNALKDSITIQRSVNGAAFTNLVTGLSTSISQYLDNTTSAGNSYQYRVAIVYNGDTGDWCLSPILALASDNQFNFSGINLEGIKLNPKP